MAAIAARTQRIRIGSAGVMLPHYSALKVAEQFRVLEALAPGRIDLGVGRAPGADMRTAQLLNPIAYAAAENFPQQIRDLQWWTAGQPHHGVIAHPRGPHLPKCGCSAARTTARNLRRTSACPMPLPTSSPTARVPSRRSSFTTRCTNRVTATRCRKPTICVWALAADSEAQARHLALSRDRWRVDRMRGALGPLRSPDEHRRTRFQRRMNGPRRSHATQSTGRHGSTGGRHVACLARRSVWMNRRQHMGARPKRAPTFVCAAGAELSSARAQPADAAHRIHAARRLHHARRVAQGHGAAQAVAGEGDGRAGPGAGGRRARTAKDAASCARARVVLAQTRSACAPHPPREARPKPPTTIRGRTGNFAHPPSLKDEAGFGQG